MGKNGSLFGVAVLLVAASSPAAEFALERKTIAAEQTATGPGGGPVGELSKRRPKEITKEPKAVSRDPLYGLVGLANTSREHFRMDESKGTGKGYDRLLVDLNHNGDLSDDPVFKGLLRPQPAPLPDQIVFGPIDLPPGKQVGPWQPSVYAVAELRADEVLLFPTRNEPAGILRIKPGWHLEATVEVDGVKEKIGIVDADRDLQLTGDAPGGGAGQYVHINGSDAVLRDRDGSGRFEFDLCESEIDDPSELVGIGRNLYELTLAKDLRSIRLDRYQGPVGQMIVVGRPDRIRALTLLRRGSGNQEERFKPAWIDGTATVPAGTYELQSCVVAATGRGPEAAMSWAWKYEDREKIEIEAGKTATLRCGPPLELRVTAKKAVGGGAGGTPQVDINVAVVGAAGEMYVRHVKGSDLTTRADPPQFRVFDEAGKEVASGRFEYG